MLISKKAAACGAVLALAAGQAHAGAAVVVDLVQEAARAITHEIERQEAERAQRVREEGVSVSRDQLHRMRRIDEREDQRDADVRQSDQAWREAGRQPRTPIRFEPLR